MAYNTKKLESLIREQTQYGRLCVFFHECDSFDNQKRECVGGNYKFCETYYKHFGEYASGKTSS